MAELTFAEISKLLKYEPETGKLFWLPRPVEMFKVTKNRKETHNQAMWNARFAGVPAFETVDGKGYLHGAIFGKIYSAHRVVWLLHYGEWPSENIDHINGVRADNRIVNLRNVSSLENQKNVRRPKTNKSGVMGVNWYKASGMWRARIRCDGKEIHLGHFPDMASAIAARKKAEKDYGFHPNHGRL